MVHRNIITMAAVAAVAAILAVYMVAFHVIYGGEKTMLASKASTKSYLTQRISLVSKLMQHPRRLAMEVVGDKNGLANVDKSSKLSASAKSGPKEEYYHSAFPTNGRKGIGPGLSFGDPVLNKKNKYKMQPRACVLRGDCDKEGSEAYLDWRNLKQVHRSADEQMEEQLTILFKRTGMSLKDCQDGFEEDEKMVEKCQRKAARDLCYKFESLSHTCKMSANSRINREDQTVYFDKSYNLKACKTDTYKAMSQMCSEVEKLPGIVVSHWPWQGHSMNLE
ncbi:hypothetical protein GUITHDRAFT_139451 [Guillardia theta CCMP2712]|uniref:Uncharacterized protein n=2 Tax=Guillardia theta TaxID=55529 RepID=L1J8I7_GUITC|nr:hypothetical protein GUITHDRAFT_139451 [Guillardia theta CCMP2712]EKX44826.1 hypothetical protein GUITHDRAFT_139451 [Guillardia theta CCMP2712]|eukprot:XP_005831806.1 hypothetical protein GUITHDRAFT_139451 [Guillardia theta CCMP2712]